MFWIIICIQMKDFGHNYLYRLAKQTDLNHVTCCIFADISSLKSIFLSTTNMLMSYSLSMQNKMQEITSNSSDPDHL